MTQLAWAQVAPISRRAIAYVIDALIASGIGIVLGGILLATALSSGLDGMLATLAIGGPVVSLVLLGWFVVYTLMQSGKGSIGMRAQGIRLVRASDGEPLGFGRALLRNVVFGLAAAIVVGYFTPLFDGSGRFQGWHDRVGDALMVDGRVPTAPPAPETTALPVVGSPTADAGPPAPAFPPTVPGAPVVAAAALPSVPPIPAPPVPGGFVPPSLPPRPPLPATAPVDQPAPPRPPAPQPAAAEDALIAFVPGVTQDGPPPRTEPEPPTPAAAPQPPAAPAAEAFAPGETQLRSAVVPPAPASDAEPEPTAPSAAVSDPADDVEETRISIPGHRLVFTWDDGTRVSVSRRTVFGRNPQPEDGAVIVSVRDETLSLSKTHFEAAAEATGGWVIDRHSTNGTTVVRDGDRIACPPGERVRIRLGDAIEIGDRIVTIGGYA